MENSKSETMDVALKVETVKRRIGKKEDEIRKKMLQIQAEEKIIESHKAKLLDHRQKLERLEKQKKVLRLDLIDLLADDAKIDRNKFFEQIATAATLKSDSEHPNESGDCNQEIISESTNSKKNNEVDSLEQVRAAIMKNHPNGISLSDRAKI